MALFDFLTDRAKEPDALELMKQDHKIFKDLLKKLNETTTRGEGIRARLFTSLSQQLIAHEFMEEKVIYPALRKHSEAKGIVLEGLQEHHTADLLLKELKNLPVTSESWGPKCHVMGEGIEHHIKEEENKMFVEARTLLDEAELLRLGGRMARKRQQKLEQLTARGVNTRRPGKTKRPSSARSAQPSRGRKSSRTRAR